jgi:hypothetical protein
MSGPPVNGSASLPFKLHRTPPELKAQIDSMKAKKNSYDKLLTQLQVINQKEASEATKMALTREDLARFREMRASIIKRLEQLVYDAKAVRSR